MDCSALHDPTQQLVASEASVTAQRRVKFDLVAAHAVLRCDRSFRMSACVISSIALHCCHQSFALDPQLLTHLLLQRLRFGSTADVYGIELLAIRVDPPSVTSIQQSYCLSLLVTVP